MVGISFLFGHDAQGSLYQSLGIDYGDYLNLFFV